MIQDERQAAARTAKPAGEEGSHHTVQGVQRLKELLFEREAREIGALGRRLEEVARRDEVQHEEVARRLDTVFERAGTEERMRASVAAVLDGALVDAEVKRHDELSKAMAPLVVKTIKTELVNSRDEMVEALYPITGRLVAAYVSNAVKDMMADINRRLEAGLSGGWFGLKAKSVASGSTMAEVALAETARLEVEELFLIRRGSGELVERWASAGAVAPAGDNRSALVGGFLTAITEFAKEAFASDATSLQTLDMQTHRVYVRASPAFLLAAKCRGLVPPGAERMLDEEFLRALESHPDRLGAQAGRAGAATAGQPTAGKGAPVIAAMLPGIAKSLESRVAAEEALRQRRGKRRLKVAALVLLAPFIIWGSWSAYQGWLTSTTRRAAQQVIAASPDLVGYPIRLDVARGGGRVTLAGLVPTADVQARLLSDMKRALPGTEIVSQIAAIPAAPVAPDVEPHLAAVRQTIATVGEEAARATTRRALERARGRLGIVAGDVARLDQPGASDAVRRATGELKLALGEVEQGLRSAGDAFSGSRRDPAGEARAVEALVLVERRFLAATSRFARALGAESRAGAMPGAQGGTRGDAGEAAEGISLSLERLSTLLAMAEQVMRIAPMERKLAGLEERIANIRIPAPTIVQQPPPAASPRDLLEAFARSRAVFFANEADYRDEAEAQRVIEELAGLMQRSKLIVRVVGYTDERGTAQRNQPLAQSRATKVANALIERGVSRERLIAVGRAAGRDITSLAGAGSTNRRVEFEVGFDGEGAGGDGR